MATYAPNFIKAYLATALTAGATSATIVLDRITNLNGETLETADLTTLGRGVITINPDGDGVTSYPESASFTGVTAATKTLIGAKRGLDKAAAENTTYMRYHPVGTPVIVSFGVHQIADIITYLNTLVVSTRSVIVSGVAGETLVAGNLVYLKNADGRWWKSDADDATTVENVQLGIAQGAGVAAGTITTGVLIHGKDLTNTGLTQVKYFASNTAGGISTSAGTKEVSVGFGTVDGYLYFIPRYDQQLTEDQQDALAGSSGTPSATNLFVTQSGLQANTGVYYASAVGTDAYAITPSPAIAAYANGMKFMVKADVANTGAATLNVSALGAITIKKLNDQDLSTGDIEANQIFEVVYNSTGPVFQMQSQIAQLSLSAQMQVFTGSGTWTKPSGVSVVTVKVVGGGGGGGGCSNAAGTIAGGGGGAGGYSEGEVAVTGNVTVTVGALGAGGVGAAVGSNGGTSSFAGSTTVAATGGTGGDNGATDDAAAYGGAGGTGSVGDLNMVGQKGGTGRIVNTVGFSGCGGSGPLGMGGVAAEGSNTGLAGSGYGAGGGGAASADSATKTGGAGTGGVVIVYWVE